jgi:hypothetical protein
MNVFLMIILYVLYLHEEAPQEDSSVRGSNPGWKDTFAIDEKGVEIYHMQRTEAWFQG